MIESAPDSEQNIPTRALWAPITVLAAPVLGTLLLPDQLAHLAAILWLLALAPAFPLAVHRGWRGVAVAASVTGSVFVVTLVIALLIGRQLSFLLPWVALAYLAISAGIARVVHVLHRERADVRDLALTDNLTRLPNRRHARTFLDNEFAAARRGALLSVALFDLDGFKAFNDVHGHRSGDRALERFGEILLATTRRMNLSSRFGGEEFLSVLSGSDEAGAVTFAERVRQALESVRLPQGSLTVSAGVAEYHPSMSSPDELIAAADLALYRAKRDGRNCVRVFGAPENEPKERPAREAAASGDGEVESARAQEVEQTHGSDSAARDYPREDSEIGRSPPSADLLPDQLTRLGRTNDGRSADGDARGGPEGSEIPASLVAARAIVRAVDARDPLRPQGASRVADFAEAIACAAGIVPSKLDVETLRLACELRDVGLVGISENLFVKKGPLTRENVLEIQRHPVIGQQILEALDFDEHVMAVARWHHERWDGSGYPDGLSGYAIPDFARIVAIADTLHAMTSARAYRVALPWQVAVEQISGSGGTQFDPVLVDRFRTVLPELESLGVAAGAQEE